MGLVGSNYPMKGEVLTLAPYFLSTPNNISTMNNKEVFKDIPGFEGLYQVSNYGNVKSLQRLDRMNRPVKEKLLKPRQSSNSYLDVCLCNNGSQTYTIHQLVAMAFLNHQPCGYKMIIDHKDFNRTNNCLSNLKLISVRENTNQKHRKSSSSYTGVSWHKKSKKWYACIRIDNKTKNLGYFLKEGDAAIAYQIALSNIKVII